MDYSGTTIWRDEGLRGRAGYRRPESVRVRAVGEVEVEGGSRQAVLETGDVTVTAGGGWEYEFVGLPSHRGGRAIAYRVVETDVPAGFAATYDGTDVINTPVGGAEDFKDSTLHVSSSLAATNVTAKSALADDSDA